MKLLICYFFTIVFFVSCKKEKVFTSEKLIGTWYHDCVLILPNGELGVQMDSIISNITNKDNGKIYINNIFDSYNNASPDLGFYVTMINNEINIESQNFNFGTISGNGIYIDNNKFILNTISSDSDQYRFTFYR